jgi:hypothetical protein
MDSTIQLDSITEILTENSESSDQSSDLSEEINLIDRTYVDIPTIVESTTSYDLSNKFSTASQSDLPFELFLDLNEATIPISTSIDINCHLLGGIAPYSDIIWLKNSDDDPLIITNITSTNVRISCKAIGTFVVYATATDSADHTSSKQFIIKITHPSLKTSIQPSEITIDIGNTISLAITYTGGAGPKIEDIGWLPNVLGGYEAQTKGRSKIVIKGMTEGTHILSAYVSDSETTSIAHATIVITNDYPWINYFILMIDKIKKVNNDFFDRMSNYLNGFKLGNKSRDSFERN